MSSVHCVVVWEWQSNGQWLPHTPSVTRTLERAHAKKLTRVVLADADPALKGHYVNLRTLTQTFDTADGVSVECRVQRSCYSVQSPAARGVRWEWARFVAPPMSGELNYEPMPMELQCVVEEAWGGGAGVWWRGWALSAARLTARRGPLLRLLRRAPAPPYPLTRADPAPPPPPDPPERHHTGGRARIPQQHTGSSVQSVQSAPGGGGGGRGRGEPPEGRGGGARSASPRERKPNLARQILHNLNIFSTNKQPAAVQVEQRAEQQLTDTESSSTRSNRRHSVDTVSTYLSHESKESLQQASVGELLNCSAGSDDVFDCPPPAAILPDHDDTAHGLELCTEEGAEEWAPWGCEGPPRCLLTHLPAQEQRWSESVSAGSQPAGSMAWSLQPGALPGHPPGSNSILVTYNFQSGRQSAGHPSPGAPYYAVGFPRYSLLPDTPLGRQVLWCLRSLWERGELFGVRASRTTGREHVVAWRAPPAARCPPPAPCPPPAHSAPPAPCPPPAHLRAARDRLLHLLHTSPHTH